MSAGKPAPIRRARGSAPRLAQKEGDEVMDISSRVRSISRLTLPNFLGGLAVVVVVSLSGWFWAHYSGSSTTTSITSPKKDESVPHMTQIDGRYSSIHKNLDLWIVVQPVNAPAYHIPRRHQ